jgi:hypothetical protein
MTHERVEQVDRVGQVGWVGQVVPALAQRVRAEFLEMPGLSVTFWQAMRLWNLEEQVCRAVLDVLVRGGFLTETRNGAFRRVGG